MSESWFTLTVAESPSLRMLFADIADHVRRARLTRRLAPDAMAYANNELEGVRLWVNAAAVECLDVFRRLALKPTPPPSARERVNALIEG